MRSKRPAAPALSASTANDDDEPVHNADPVYHLVYTEDWRMVAVYRGSDSTSSPPPPKERHLPGVAGPTVAPTIWGGGFASVAGPDSEILRDKDASTAWSAAADGLDERRYLCQNWRGDASAVITDGGALVEWVKFSPYGVPTALPTGDTDSDCDFDATDAGAISGGWSARKDVNLDGFVDPDDISDAITYNGGTYQTASGVGMVSRTPTANRKGYAGYEHDRVVGAAFTHVRHRAYRMDLGRFTQPDPLGYVDGVNRFAANRGDPVANVDADGLCAGPVCSTDDRQGVGPRPSDPTMTPGLFDISAFAVPKDYPWCCSMTSGYCYRLLRDLAARACSIPTIRRASCDPGVRGFYDCATNTITVCGTGTVGCDLIVHELIHARDYCMGQYKCDRPRGGTGGPSSCRELVCTEIRAYAYSPAVATKPLGVPRTIV